MPMLSDISEDALRRLARLKADEVGSLTKLSYEVHQSVAELSRAIHGGYIPGALVAYLGYERIEVRYNVYRKKAK
jgi:hypothetical protein